MCVMWNWEVIALSMSKQSFIYANHNVNVATLLLIVHVDAWVLISAFSARRDQGHAANSRCQCQRKRILCVLMSVKSYIDNFCVAYTRILDKSV